MEPEFKASTLLAMKESENLRSVGNLPYDMKFPIFLLATYLLTDLSIKEAHHFFSLRIFLFLDNVHKGWLGKKF